MRIFVFVMIGLIAIAYFCQAEDMGNLLVYLFFIVLAIKGLISVFKKPTSGRIAFGKARRTRNMDK